MVFFFFFACGYLIGLAPPLRLLFLNCNAGKPPLCFCPAHLPAPLPASDRPDATALPCPEI